ncbi:MAG: MFS transporter [Patescibacteria group bacterium]
MKHSSIGRKTGGLYTISIIGFFATLHVALPSYFNSSFLSTLTEAKNVSLIYGLVALVSIVGLLSMNTVLRKWGNYTTSLSLIIIQMAVFAGIIFADSVYIVAPLFVLGLSITALIGFTLDIFLEKNTDVNHTGGIRGTYMTTLNAAWILSPILGGALIVGTSYANVYLAGLAFLFPLAYLIHKNFSTFVDRPYPDISVRGTFQAVIRNADMIKIFVTNIVLQTFYAWMTVYTPLYMAKLGFSWYEISIIFTIMLIPFVLLEYPLGKLADRKWGEKEMLAIGFIIMGATTCAIAFFDYKSFVWWVILLFITRIGAATAEMMIETYFFKKVPPGDSEMLGMFRVTRPISFFIAPLITLVGLIYVAEAHLFIILGVLCLVTLFPILRLRDTN